MQHSIPSFGYATQKTKENQTRCGGVPEDNGKVNIMTKPVKSCGTIQSDGSDLVSQRWGRPQPSMTLTQDIHDVGLSQPRHHLCGYKIEHATAKCIDTRRFTQH